MLFFSDILVGGGQPSTILAVLTFCALALPRPSRSVHLLLGNPASRLLLAFLAVAGVSIMMSLSAPRSEWKGEVLWIKSLKQCLQLVISYMCFAVPLLYADTPGRLLDGIRRYAWTIWLAVAYGALEILHYFGWSSGLFSLAAAIVHHGTFFGSPEEANRVYLRSLQGFPRVRLLGSEPSMTGNFLVSVLPLVLYTQKLARSLWWKLAALCGVGLLFLTFSLGAWTAAILAYLAGIGVLFFYRQRLPLFAVAMLIFSFLYLLTTGSERPAESSPLVIPYDVMQRFARTSTDTSVAGRTLENKTAWRIFLDYPVLGVGIGNWVFHYPERMNQVETAYQYLYKQLTGSGFSRPAGINNLYLRLLCETGAIGALSFCLFLLVVTLAAIRIGRLHFRYAELGVALTTSCIALLVDFNSMSAFDKRYWWFIFGLVAASSRGYLNGYRIAPPIAKRLS